MKEYKVTFIGHRDIDRSKELGKKLYELIYEIIERCGFATFYVGNDGEFDVAATAAVRAAKRNLGNEVCDLHLVLPYPKANLDLLDMQFDSVIIPDELYKIHPKRAIIARNRWMLEQSDLLICYVNKPVGGAAMCLKLAKNMESIKIINLADLPCDVSNSRAFFSL